MTRTVLLALSAVACRGDTSSPPSVSLVGPWPGSWTLGAYPPHSLGGPAPGPDGLAFVHCEGELDVTRQSGTAFEATVLMAATSVPVAPDGGDCLEPQTGGACGVAGVRSWCHFFSSAIVHGHAAADSTSPFSASVTFELPGDGLEKLTQCRH